MPIATNSDKIDLSSEKKTEELADKILKKLKVGDVVFLYGEIGVGKTTFIKYLINGFQKENKLKLTEVTSPTFNLLNEYQINHININHYDLFRLKSVEEIKNLGLFDDITNLITLPFLYGCFITFHLLLPFPIIRVSIFLNYLFIVNLVNGMEMEMVVLTSKSSYMLFREC